MAIDRKTQLKPGTPETLPIDPSEASLNQTNRSGMPRQGCCRKTHVDLRYGLCVAIWKLGHRLPRGNHTHPAHAPHRQGAMSKTSRRGHLFQ